MQHVKLTMNTLQCSSNAEGSCFAALTPAAAAITAAIAADVPPACAAAAVLLLLLLLLHLQQPLLPLPPLLLLLTARIELCCRYHQMVSKQHRHSPAGAVLLLLLPLTGPIELYSKGCPALLAGISLTVAPGSRSNRSTLLGSAASAAANAAPSSDLNHSIGIALCCSLAAHSNAAASFGSANSVNAGFRAL
jgi:hypothetical protein